MKSFLKQKLTSKDEKNEKLRETVQNCEQEIHTLQEKYDQVQISNLNYEDDQKSSAKELEIFRKQLTELNTLLSNENSKTRDFEVKWKDKVSHCAYYKWYNLYLNHKIKKTDEKFYQEAIISRNEIQELKSQLDDIMASPKVVFMQS
jgi:chromosome segregation ATPase